jgi:hypothetical protein
MERSLALVLVFRGQQYLSKKCTEHKICLSFLYSFHSKHVFLSDNFLTTLHSICNRESCMSCYYALVFNFNQN